MRSSGLSKNTVWNWLLRYLKLLLNLPNLEIISADKELALSALRLMRDCHLAPRDALHAATAIACGVDFLVTSDAHFSRVKELKVKGFE